MKKVIIRSFGVTLLVLFSCYFTGAQVMRARNSSKPAAENSTNAVAVANRAVNTSIVNTFKLSDGQVLKTYFTGDNSKKGSVEYRAVQKVNTPQKGSDRMIIAVINQPAKDRFSVYGITKHNVESKDIPGNSTTDANGMVCTSGTISLNINSTDQLPIGSREFMQRFKPGTVFDITQEAALMQSISNARKPISLYCDVTGEAVVVNNPTESELNAVIAGLLKNLPSKSSSIISAKSEEISSEEEFALKISGGAKCAYGSVSGLFDFKNNKSAYRFLFDFSEESAVISADSKGDSFFTDAAMQNNTAYGFVKAATYGRRILVCVETKKYSSLEQEKLDLTFNAVFASGDAHLDKTQKTMFSNCTVKVFAVGGSNKDAGIISTSDAASLKQVLQNYLTDFDNTMLLPIKVNMSDLNGVPKKTEMSGNVPYVKCFNPTEKFRLSIKSVELVSDPPGMRSTYRMWGSCWIKAYDYNGVEIDDVYKRSPQLMVTDKSSNYIPVSKGEQNSYKFNNNFNREFQMDTRNEGAKIVFTSALDDNGDVSDSEQKGEYSLYMKDILAAIGSGNNGNESDGIVVNVNGGGFLLKITVTVSK